MTKPMEQPANAPAIEDDREGSRHRDFHGPWRAVLGGIAVLSLIFSVYIIFNLGTVAGYVPFETQYFYALQALLIPVVFLVFPMREGDTGKLTLIDGALALLAFAVFAYMAFNGRAVMDSGWEYDAPVMGVAAAFAAWVLILEATRRAGGKMLFIVCLIFSVYPAVGFMLPGFLETPRNAWSFAATYHAFGTESIIGLPTNVFAQLIIGYLLFGVALQYTGGGAFFLNLAFALLGRFRGGPAKVSVVASGMMGSLSGSVVSNVLTTGVLTIPAMKKVGFRASYAAGVEACASTGGALMPPIMGAAAFIMAFVLSVPYSAIVVAAVIPSLLYYLALFVQIDAYAARHGLKGLPVRDIPRLGQVLREGWYFVLVLTLLIFLLLYMQQEAQAPFYATVLLIVLNQFSRRHRWGWGDVTRFLEASSRLFAELCAVVAGVGMIIGALSLTGKVGTIAYEIVRMAGDSTLALLVMGALTCFILGTGMTSSAAYLFLAITLAPGLVDAGLNPIAIHMFILYWAMISFITPPVALGSFCAATLAGSPPWKAGMEGMRLGSVIYFVPFFFVINPALVAQAPMPEVMSALGFAIAGVILIAAGMQGYLIGLGTVSGSAVSRFMVRGLLIVSGFVFALPGGDFTGFSHFQLAGIAAVAAAVAVAIMLVSRSARGEAAAQRASP